MADQPSLFDEPTRDRKTVYQVYAEECAEKARKGVARDNG